MNISIIGEYSPPEWRSEIYIKLANKRLEHCIVIWPLTPSFSQVYLH